MGMRPAKIYRDPPNQPFTRKANVKEKAYISGVPAPRIARYENGNADRAKTEGFDSQVNISLTEDCCVRSNALEAARVAANSYLRKNVETKHYYLRIHVYPHHILRYHPLAGVAQADRYYEGMRRPFGRPDGTAAICNAGQTVISAQVDSRHTRQAREALRRAGNKFPVSVNIRVA